MALNLEYLNSYLKRAVVIVFLPRLLPRTVPSQVLLHPPPSFLTTQYPLKLKFISPNLLSLSLKASS